MTAERKWESATTADSQNCESEIEYLRKLAYEDELTGLANRRSFNQQIRKSLAFSSRYGGPVSLVALDLDQFKRLNDECGHPIGDKVLRRVAAALQSAIRAADHAVRLGGDEFAVILPNTSLEDAIDVAERVRVQVESLLVPGGHRVTTSVGVATAVGAEDPQGLYIRADQALYRAKALGGNCTKLDLYTGGTQPRHADQ